MCLRKCGSSWFWVYGNRWSVKSASKWAYWGWSVRVFGIKYCLCLRMYSCGRLWRRVESGHGFSSMSPCSRMRVELFQL